MGEVTIYISRKIYDEIISSIGCNHYETGGIIGFDKNGIIAAFQLDRIKQPALYEYYPDIDFLHDVLWNDWEKSEIRFAGFVHSHLHNDCLSKEDVDYARKILFLNNSMVSVLMGVIDLSCKKTDIKWFCIDRKTVFCKEMENVLKSVEVLWK